MLYPLIKVSEKGITNMDIEIEIHAWLQDTQNKRLDLSSLPIKVGLKLELNLPLSNKKLRSKE